LSYVIYFSDDELKITNAEAAKSLEVEGVKAAESGDLDKAIGIFTRAINIAPKWASGYNNRAQAYRLKGDGAGICHIVHQSDQSLPPNIEVKNEWHCISTSLCLHDVHRDSFTFHTHQTQV
jgi:tetratricopeptide (TPR) repeat protein